MSHLMQALQGYSNTIVFDSMKEIAVDQQPNMRESTKRTAFSTKHSHTIVFPCCTKHACSLGSSKGIHAILHMDRLPDTACVDKSMMT